MTLLWQYNEAKHLQESLLVNNHDVQKRLAEAARGFTKTIPELYRLPLLHILRDCANEMLMSNTVALEEVCHAVGLSLNEAAPLVAQTCVQIKQACSLPELPYALKLQQESFASSLGGASDYYQGECRRSDRLIFAYLHALLLVALYKAVIEVQARRWPAILTCVREHLWVYKPSLATLIEECWQEPYLLMQSACDVSSRLLAEQGDCSQTN